eukprot:Seg119.4 transcript_id=Seg119.4/GoldUCD/mRNA.D3Y31 product="hypothetical protein" protein_id=Seg119.4/GoldUCD/D3Y31
MLPSLSKKEKRLKENCKDVFGDDRGWSSWKRAVVPAQNVDEVRRFDARGIGLVSRNISRRNPFGHGGNSQHGLFEFEVRAPYGNRMVVFLGRPTYGSLYQQIKEHCIGQGFGSRQKRLIDDAVKYGYELYVRIKPLANAEEEEAEWQDILDECDYAWNDHARDVLFKQAWLYFVWVLLNYCAYGVGWFLMIGCVVLGLYSYFCPGC